jgi:hypothetical protein
MLHSFALEGTIGNRWPSRSRMGIAGVPLPGFPNGGSEDSYTDASQRRLPASSKTGM